MRSTSRAVLIISLVACSPASAETLETYDVSTELLVVKATTNDDEVLSSWEFEMASAPSGDYFVFVAEDEPTNFDALRMFDPGRCASTCTVDGIGELITSTKHGGATTLDLLPRRASELDTVGYYTLYHRSVSSSQPLSIKTTISSVSRSGGCGGTEPTGPTIERLR